MTIKAKARAVTKATRPVRKSAARASARKNWNGNGHAALTARAPRAAHEIAAVSMVRRMDRLAVEAVEIPALARGASPTWEIRDSDSGRVLGCYARAEYEAKFAPS